MYTALRPHLHEFLEAVSRKYELVIYTAAEVREQNANFFDNHDIYHTILSHRNPTQTNVSACLIHRIVISPIGFIANTVLKSLG